MPLLAGCGRAAEPYRQESYVFGTRVELTLYADEPTLAARAAGSVLADLDRLHRQLHAWAPDSEVAAANRALASGQPFTPSPELAELLRQGQRLEALSDGLFSPGIGALVAAWGFHADSYAARLPVPGTLAALVAARPRLADIRWQHGQPLGRKPALQLDFGGMAKGWALDRARRSLLKAGISSALLNIGGNIMALGRKPDGTPWRVGIRHPRHAAAMLSLALHDGEALGTSGDYQRYFELGGRRYCHLIDPRDGNADCRVQSVSVLAMPGRDAGLLSDVASKPLYFAGAEQAAKLARRFALAGWLLVDAQGAVWVTPALRQRLQWQQPPDSLHVTGAP
ncbi:FAD:protein FMN transferase [Vogesella facilis]|uniref:FAD:protein FMN transferase n=1 Tax=Vogesella facilis TaxID=1655232 RepID=A0ABV7RGJ8_9NEIS